MPEPLDLRHLGHERVIGSYLLETEDGLALLRLRSHDLRCLR